MNARQQGECVDELLVAAGYSEAAAMRHPEVDS